MITFEKNFSGGAPNSLLTMYVGTMRPVFDLGSVNAKVFPFRSASDFAGLFAGVMMYAW